MIAPLTSFSIAGVLWYQGESNVVAPRLMRSCWDDDRGLAQGVEQEFSFLLCADRTVHLWDEGPGALLREQEAAVQDLGGTGMVVISDLVTDTTNIHPKDKHDVGIRLANWALAETYHRPGLSYKNPRYLRMETKGDRVILSFADAPNGLVVKGRDDDVVCCGG